MVDFYNQQEINFRLSKNSALFSEENEACHARSQLTWHENGVVHTNPKTMLSGLLAAAGGALTSSQAQLWRIEGHARENNACQRHNALIRRFYESQERTKQKISHKTSRSYTHTTHTCSAHALTLFARTSSIGKPDQDVVCRIIARYNGTPRSINSVTAPHHCVCLLALFVLLVSCVCR